MPIPWNKGKSLGGAVAVFIGGLVLSGLVLSIFVMTGTFPQPFTAYLPGLIGIALTGTFVESLPLKDVDNLTVSLAAVIVGLFFF